MSIAPRSAREILGDVTKLAIEYYEATGKPLGITGEIAELEAAERLGLTLANARTAGYDATRARNGTMERVQIKGRRVARAKPYKGRMPAIDLSKEFECVVVVLFDEAFSPFEIWEAPRAAVEQRLMAPGSKARNERGSMELSQFKSIAKRVWSASTAA